MPATEPRPEDGQQFLSFFFAGEEYATEILRIREVVEYQRLTPVPTTPPWVRGVMNLRGTVVPVVDLALKLQQSETPVEKLTCVVIFEVDLDGEPTPVGVMIDQIGRVFELQGDEIHEPPAFGSPVRPELLEGIGMVDDKPVPILHIQKVLTEDELAATVAGTEALDNEDGRNGSPAQAAGEAGTRPVAEPERKAASGARTKTERKPKPAAKPRARKGSKAKPGATGARSKTTADDGSGPAAPPASAASGESGATPKPHGSGDEETGD